MSGRGVLDNEGKMSKTSQCIFLARRGTVERVWGRIIHRMTRDIVRGSREVVERVWIKVGREVEGVRERRWIVQIGIFEDVEFMCV